MHFPTVQCNVSPLSDVELRNNITYICALGFEKKSGVKAIIDKLSAEYWKHKGYYNFTSTYKGSFWRFMMNRGLQHRWLDKMYLKFCKAVVPWKLWLNLLFYVISCVGGSYSLWAPSFSVGPNPNLEAEIFTFVI